MVLKPVNVLEKAARSLTSRHFYMVLKPEARISRLSRGLTSRHFYSIFTWFSTKIDFTGNMIPV